MTKMTYVNAINEAINGNLTVEVIEKLEALKASLEKKNKGGSAKKSMTKTQKENVTLKENIVASMEAETEYTISEMVKTFECLEGLTNQKVSALVRQLCISGEVIRTEEKGKAYFHLA